MSTGYPPIDNARFRQILRHAGVRIRAIAPHRVSMESDPDDGVDPLTKIILLLEPSASRGNEHMPSVEEAIDMGLVEDD